MQPRKFTQAELAALIGEAVMWLRQEREKYYVLGEPLAESIKLKLRPFFSPEVLERLRIKDLSVTGETIPYPPFYERVRAGGGRAVPEAAHMTAIPFVDVAPLNRQPTLRMLFHSLVHVSQFSILGLEKVMRGYFETLNESGLWMVVPFEEQAYGLDARFTKDPNDHFSVEAEIREWQRKGKY